MTNKILSYIAGVVAIVAVALVAGQMIAPTSVAATTVTCNNSGDLSATTTGSATTKTVTIKNNSTTCTYSVGVAIYKIPSSVFTEQILADSKTGTLKPGESATYTVTTADCNSQLDVFIGSVIQSFASGQIYGNRKIAQHNTSTNSRNGYCPVDNPPPAPTAQAVCSSNNTPTLNVSWDDFNMGSKGYHLDITNNSSFSKGGYYTVIPSGTTSFTTTNLDSFRSWDTPGTKSFAQGTVYNVRILYVATGLYSPVVSVTIPQCQTTTSDISLTCSASPSSVEVNQNVTWSANATGGNGSYTYSWTGDDNASSNSQSFQKSYGSTGTKNATVTVTSGGKTAQKQCSVNVTSHTTNNPNVSVSQYCQANNQGPALVVNWNDAGMGQDGYFVDITDHSDFNGAFWHIELGSGTNNLTITNSSGFSGYNGETRTFSLNNNTTYLVRIYYKHGDTHSDNASVTTSQCQTSNGSFDGSCSANPWSPGTGANVTFTASANGGSGNYSYSWSGDDGLNGTDNSVSHVYWNTGTKNAQVTISDGSQSIVRNCPVNVWSGGGGGGGGSYLSATCSANPSSVYVGDTVTWTANAYNGNGSYNYSWNGTDNLQANSSRTVQYTYTTPGQKQATVTVTSNGQTVNQTCTVYVSPRGQVAGTFTSQTGGGVYLSQVPYTGIGSEFKVGFFLLALIGWSVGVSYMLIKRKADKSGMSVRELISSQSGKGLAFAGGPVSAPSAPSAPSATTRLTDLKQKMERSIPIMKMMPRADVSVTPYEPAVVSPRPVVASTPVAAAPVMASVVAPAHASSKEDVLTAVESKARELETLVSADGLIAIGNATNYNKHNALIMLNHLVEFYKDARHDAGAEWLVIDAEKVANAVHKNGVTPVSTFIEWLTQGDDKKAMAYLRMIQLQGGSIATFITSMVLELDKIYRNRVENEGQIDPKIQNLVSGWTNEHLEYAIHTLVGAVDQTYSSVYSAVKIALIKIFKISKELMA